VSAAIYPRSSLLTRTILGVAQYLAVQRAQARSSAGASAPRSDRGAVAGASFVTMSYLFPASVQAFQDLLTAQANAGPGQPHPSFAAGEAIGSRRSARNCRARDCDHFNDPNTAVPPPGGRRAGSGLPMSLARRSPADASGTTPWFLTSSDQFKPDPPHRSALQPSNDAR